MINVTSYDVLVEAVMLYPMGFVLQLWDKIIVSYKFTSQISWVTIGNNTRAKFASHRFLWRRHECHSSICIV
jgi:hypothetical protein